MQLDLFDILNEEALQARKSLEATILQERIAESRQALGWDEYEKLKSELALQIEINNLPWVQSHPNMRTGYEHVDVQVIIPPDVLSPMEYHLRLNPKGKLSYRDDNLRVASRDLWSSYNFAVWRYEPHQVDWCGAMKLLTRHRDAGDPIWVRISRIGGRLLYGALPDCIVKIEGGGITNGY
ncbi:MULTISPECIES: hypothetical protein [unclassified Paenibacillus]|uniref:hypothetical protein n=1 Tax=unclassified Paenibacillus TaxID=185978 RepID=UPI0024065380|nr:MULTISPECIES: hypothetical protein [unclassified Paenibacillus]MDF9845127.1 hypothetical protein [Paenibacillus sp. PastF-2]MDF9851726.1 hypothetical protein [Paenibacillus sp. PastM-2]MDF9858321.1 hypothetical protein [Paenibacillus sp. PastF-1]MDH6483599.1 hypothetical protein [Paenibacillus sp. PastH-2]MDH6510996.1 hypothetical protein [Paenibacillus sp. PastM-3]